MCDSSWPKLCLAGSQPSQQVAIMRMATRDAIIMTPCATTIVMEHFDAAQYLGLIGRYGVTHSQVVPTMFSRLLKLPEELRQAADLSTLEVIIHPAAPCPISAGITPELDCTS